MAITTNAELLGFRASKYSKNKGNLSQATGGVGKGYLDKENAFNTEADIADPYLDNVVLLLKGNNSYANAKGALAVASTNINFSSAMKKWGSHSFMYDGTLNSRLVATSQAPITNDFCMETWLFLNSYNPSGSWLFDLANNNQAQGCYIDGDGKLTVYQYGNSNANGSAPSLTVPYYQWVHIAFNRIGTTWKLRCNGVTHYSAEGGAVSIGANSISIGNRYANSYDDAVRGYMDEVRVTVGHGRYASDFTPPTGPYASA